MSLLSDHEIIQQIDAGNISIEPLLDKNSQIQPASIDLRLGNEFLIFNMPQTAVIDPADPQTFEGLTTSVTLQAHERFIVHPKEFILGVTLERVNISADFVGRLDGRSSLGRLGIIVHSTAGFIDPGFNGTITLEISNLNNIAVAIYPGMRICQLSIEQLSQPASQPYSAARQSKYQGQTKPTLSHIFNDQEMRDRRKR